MKLTSSLLTGAICLALAAGAIAADKPKQVELPIAVTGQSAAAPANEGNLRRLSSALTKRCKAPSPIYQYRTSSARQFLACIKFP